MAASGIFEKYVWKSFRWKIPKEIQEKPEKALNKTDKNSGKLIFYCFSLPGYYEFSMALEKTIARFAPRAPPFAPRAFRAPWNRGPGFP